MDGRKEIECSFEGFETELFQRLRLDGFALRRRSRHRPSFRVYREREREKTVKCKYVFTIMILTYLFTHLTQFHDLLRRKL